MLDLLTLTILVRFHDETPEIASLYSADPQCPTTLIDNPIFEEAPETSIDPQPYASTADTSSHFSPIAVSHSPSISTLSPARPSSKLRHPLSEREAILMMNFVENMALWV